MGGTGEDVAGAGAEVPTGTAAMRTALMEVIVTGGMMIGITMKVVAKGTKLKVPAVQGVEVGAQVAGGAAVLVEKGVRKGELKLSSGTGRGKKQNVTVRLVLVVIIGMEKTTMAIWEMEIITMLSSHCIRADGYHLLLVRYPLINI